MAKYYLHLRGNGFIGTGFMGAPFNTREEFKAAVIQYGTYTENGLKYWREELEISISSGETIEEFKAAGDRSCKENGFVDIFALAASMKKDPLHRYKIFYRPAGWVNAQGPFKFVLRDGDNIQILRNTTMSEIFRSIGVDI